MPFDFPRNVDLDRFSEADVRAEMLDPMLRALGYQAGTTNNISREPVLRYGRRFLGHKKKSDPKLEGRPDYVLEVGSAGRWLIEAKAPHVTLTVDDFEQAQSYALHPNVAASLFVLTNGRTFKFYNSTAKSIDDLVVEFGHTDIRPHWLHLEGIVSPAGFVRNVAQVRFDARLPVSAGFAAEIRLGAGVAKPQEIRTNVPFPPDALASLVEMQTHIPRGRCARAQDGKLAISVEFGSSSSFLHTILEEKGILGVTMNTVDQFLSQEPTSPTLFSGEFDFPVRAGEQLFDFTTWQPSTVPFDMNCYARIDASGYIAAGMLVGTYALRMYFSVPHVGFNVEAEQIGEFQLDIL